MIQTDVMVFDKQGHFVPDLKMNQFELRVNGKVQPIEFFEVISAGSMRDGEIWAKAQGKPVPPPASPAANAPNPGRTLLIFLDDWHMDDENAILSRRAVTNLLNTSIGPDDCVGIFSASGELAAMKLPANDKAALLASLGRYNFHSPGVMDITNPPMTEIQAQLIEQNDYDTLAYFVGSVLGVPVVYEGTNGWTPQGTTISGGFRIKCDLAEKEVRRRAASLAETYASISQITLTALLSLLRDAEGLPGRKLVYFLSDGFVLQYRRNEIVSRLTELCTAAARGGTLIYTLDSRGLVTLTPDAETGNDPTMVSRLRPRFDMPMARVNIPASETSAPWQALRALAVDSGGRFINNTNDIELALITTLNEISRYYILGWHVEPEKLRGGKYSTISASIKGRSDLSVRVRRGSLDLSKLVQEKK